MRALPELALLAAAPLALAQEPTSDPTDASVDAMLVVVANMASVLPAPLFGYADTEQSFSVEGTFTLPAVSRQP